MSVLFDTKQSDQEVPYMLELWGMRSIPSLPLLPGPLWPRVVAPDRVLSLGQIELNCVLMLNWIAWDGTVFCMLDRIVCNRTVLTFNCVWTKTILILNLIVWIRTVWLNWIAWNQCFWPLNCVFPLNWIVWDKTVYLYKNGFGIR